MCITYMCPTTASVTRPSDDASNNSPRPGVLIPPEGLACTGRTGAQQRSGSHFIQARDEYLRKNRLGKVNLLYQPGSAWDYGFSIDVLGLIVEAETGKTLGAYLQERIWNPLGMVDTGFVVPADKAKRFARALANDPDTGKPQASTDSTKAGKFECGGGCASSTAADYVRFGQMLLNRGRLGDTRILASRTVDYMTSNHLGPNVKIETPQIPPGHGFGLGFAVRMQAGLAPYPGSVGQFYWGGAAGTQFWVDPKEDLWALLMVQAPGQRDYVRVLFRNLVYAAVES